MARMGTLGLAGPLLVMACITGAPVTANDPAYQDVDCEGAYPRHLQGICTDDKDGIYWSFTTFLVKTDRRGKLLKKIPVANHHGDLCYVDGQVYVAVNLGAFSDPKGQKADSWVYVYQADNLRETARHKTPEVVYGAGGIGHHKNRFLVIGGLPTTIKENYAYEYDATFHFSKRHVIASGNTSMGIQTATYAEGCWWFGCYGNPPVLLKTDDSFRVLGKYSFDCALGISGLANGKFLVGRGGLLPSEASTGSAVLVEPDDERGFRSVAPQGRPTRR